MTAPNETYPKARAGAPADIDWRADGAPIATRYDDIYFSRTNGRAESRHVFLEACGLPARWRRAAPFAIGELGFGVGLNFLETWATWRADQQRPPTAHLTYVSFELNPPSPDDLRRALAPWADLAPLAERLLFDWPPPLGWRRTDLADNVTLVLAIGDAGVRLPEWSTLAPPEIDAWYLDGFSPAKNPDLWSADLLAAVGRRTPPGAAAASYTAAGWVRRNLTAAGFDVVKRPGYGGKRERIIATRRAD